MTIINERITFNIGRRTIFATCHICKTKSFSLTKGDTDKVNEAMRLFSNEHENCKPVVICENCGDDEATEEIEDRDDSVGYVGRIKVCSRCFFRLRG